MKTETIEIVDRGRGLQLSTNRITVQDLVPYFHEGASHEEILRWMPALSAEELVVVEGYYRAHKEALDQEDREIRERNARNRNPEWVEKILNEARSERRAKMAEGKRSSTESP